MISHQPVLSLGADVVTLGLSVGRALNYMDVIDSIDQDTYNCLSVFMNQNCEVDDELMFYQIFYVDRITINKKYRNMGLSSILLEYIKYRFANISTAIVLQSLVFEEEEENEELFEKETKRLNNFYKKHGFKNYSENTWIYHEF